MGIYKNTYKKNQYWKSILLLYFENLIKAKKLGTKNIFINEKNCKDLMIYFMRYVHSKLIKILILHYHKLIGKIAEHEGRKYFMVDDAR